MADVIRSDVRRDIGGDEQRIAAIDTDWSDETFKHILLPVWMAAYKYNGKSYRFLVNGQTGEVQGERPWSVWKIAFAVILVRVSGHLAPSILPTPRWWKRRCRPGWTDLSLRSRSKNSCQPA